jgi:hypothetical protein
MLSVSVNKMAEGCVIPIKLASHPPSLLFPFSLPKLAHSSFTIAITRKKGKQTNLQHSRLLRSRAIPLMQPVKGPPLRQPHQNCRRRAHHFSSPARRDRVPRGTKHQQSPAIQNDEYVSCVRNSNIGSDAKFILEYLISAAAPSC